MSRLIHDEREGYQVISDNGVPYDLLEGKSLNGTMTSDIVFIMFNDRDYEKYSESHTQDDLFVGWFYGATFVCNAEKDTMDILDRLTKEYEEKNPDVVEQTRMIHRIMKTVEAYYETNREYLNEHQRYELEKQIEFLSEF